MSVVPAGGLGTVISQSWCLSWNLWGGTLEGSATERNRSRQKRNWIHDIWFASDPAGRYRHAVDMMDGLPSKNIWGWVAHDWLNEWLYSSTGTLFSKKAMTTTICDFFSFVARFLTLSLLILVPYNSTRKTLGQEAPSIEHSFFPTPHVRKCENNGRRYCHENKR